MFLYYSHKKYRRKFFSSCILARYPMRMFEKT